MNYVIPGMGASKKMYADEWLQLEGYTFLDWPEDFEGLTLPGLAAHIVDQHSIQPADAIVGTSLGGMIACEIANQIASDKIVLISSAVRSAEVSRLLEIIHPLIDFTPLEFLKRVAMNVPSELAQLFVDADAELVRRMCRAIFEWEGYNSESKLFRIHGRGDHVIPLPEDVNCVVDGGHLISVTHARECAEATQGFLSGGRS